MWSKLVLSFLLLLGLSGCASDEHATLQQINQPESSLLYGYMDMTDAPSCMAYFDMKVFPTYDKYIDFEVENGLFYHEAVPPGTYQLNEFGGTSTFFLFFFPTLHRYTFLNPDAKFKIATPSMYYLGSFKYVRDKDAFDIQRIKSPSEGDLLVRLLPKVRGTKWENVVLGRLKALGINSQ